MNDGFTTDRSRRDFLRLAAGAGAGAFIVGGSGLLAACGSSTPAATTVPSAGSLGALRIGYLPITDASPLLVAHANGTLAANGFTAPDPTLFRSWADLAESLQGGAVDAVHMLMPLAIQLRFGAKVPLKVVSWNHTNGSALTVSESIRGVTDLAGKTVAVPFWWSIHNVVLQNILRSNGLEPILEGSASASARTVKLVVLPPADMVPALASGSIAGFIVADPFNALAEVKGAGRILRFTGDVWRDHACCVTVVRESLVSDSPQAAASLANSIAQAQLAIAADRTGTARTLSEGGYLPQPLPAIERALTHYDIAEYGPTGAIVHPEWGSERIGFQPYAYPSYTKELVAALRETRIDGDTAFLADLDDDTVHAELVAEGLARDAIEANGGREAFGLESYERDEVIAP